MLHFKSICLDQDIFIHEEKSEILAFKYPLHVGTNKWISEQGKGWTLRKRQEDGFREIYTRLPGVTPQAESWKRIRIAKKSIVIRGVNCVIQNAVVTIETYFCEDV